MTSQRAKEIVSSSRMVNVTYNGANIYIETVNERDHMASIHFLNKPQSRLEVPVTSLMEH